MRILMVGMEWLPNRYGGLNRYFHGLYSALTAKGVDVRALVSSLRREQQIPDRLMGVANSAASTATVLRGFRSHVQRLIDDVDILNPHFALHAISWVGSAARRKPIIVNFQGPWADEIRAEHRDRRGQIRACIAYAIEAAVYRRADRVVTLSTSFAEIACRSYGVPIERIRIVPGGVALGPYVEAPMRQEARVRLGWPQNRPILLAVRRLARRMGLETLIDAVDLLRRSHPGVLLLIAGKGAMADELKSRVESKGMSEHVRLLGFVPDDLLPLAYAAADMTVVPTVLLEGFGLITVESLASGTPVMGTPVGGTTEILGGLCPDLLFGSTQAEGMAAKLHAALAGHVELPGRNECREYAARYAWPAVVPELLRVFNEACGARKH